MPILPNQRHEAFAQALAKGKTADEAYALAGYSPSRHNASRLTTNDNVRSRVAELQRRTAEKSTWTALERMKSLQAIHDTQLVIDPRTAIAAIQEANRMDGSHAATKHQLAGANGGPIQTIDVTKLKGMTTEELDLLERALIQIGIVDGDPGREGGEEE